MIELSLDDLNRMRTALSPLYPTVQVLDTAAVASEAAIRELCFRIGSRQVVIDIETAIAVKLKEK